MTMNVLIVGFGSMGQSIVKGLFSSGENHSLCVIENNAQNAQDCASSGIETYENFLDFSSKNTMRIDVCVLAVKPNDIGSTAQDVADTLDSKTVVLSIAAGITLEKLQSKLPGFPVVRAMPNLAASESLSATAMCSVGVSERDEAFAREILETFGTVDRVNEQDMNIVTAVSGSGPAYFFLLCEHIVSAAVQAGMNAQIAQALVLQTLQGAAALAKDSGSFSLLREQVTSPGGTTQAAVEEFEKKGLEDAIKSGIKAAIDRAIEMDEIISGQDRQ